MVLGLQHNHLHGLEVVLMVVTINMLVTNILTKVEEDIHVVVWLVEEIHLHTLFREDMGN